MVERRSEMIVHHLEMWVSLCSLEDSTACYTCTETVSLLGNMVLSSGSLVYALKNIWQLAKNICWYPRSCSGCGCVLMLEIWTLAANCPSWGGGWPVWCRCPGPHSAQPITGRDAAVSGGSTNHRPAGSCSASDHAPPPTPGGPYSLHTTCWKGEITIDTIDLLSKYLLS